MKELHIWLCVFDRDIGVYTRLQSTEQALKRKENIIHTTQPHVIQNGC